MEFRPKPMSVVCSPGQLQVKGHCRPTMFVCLVAVSGDRLLREVKRLLRRTFVCSSFLASKESGTELLSGSNRFSLCTVFAKD